MTKTSELCIECNQRPVHVHKRKLCALCYQRARKLALASGDGFQDSDSKATWARIEHACEVSFIANFFNHRNWIHHPATFNLGGNKKYTPDFYDTMRNVFIEVSGTRQAYHANKDKYELFRTRFPGLVLEIRNQDGKLYKNGDEINFNDNDLF